MGGVSAPPLIEVDGLTKRYGALVAVDNVGMQVAVGEVRAVIWKVREMPSRQIWWLGWPAIAWSANRIAPALGLTVPVMTLKSVVLPAPLGPMTARTSPSSTLMAT